MNLLRDYPALLTLADELHFGRAAERLGISQPQLSGIIKRLETRSRVAIFERRPTVQLTAAGETLVESARRSLAEAQAGLERARAVSNGSAGSIRFGFAPISLLTPLGAILKRFAKDYPDIHLDLVERHSGPLIADLEMGRLDLIVGRQQPTDAKSLEIHREPMALALPTAHDLTCLPQVRASDLEEQPLILWSRESAPDYFEEVHRAFERAGLRANVAQTVNGWSSLLALVAAGFGLGLVSKSVSTIGFPGIVYREIEEFSACASFWLSWNPASISPAADRLRGLIEEPSRISASR